MSEASDPSAGSTDRAARWRAVRALFERAIELPTDQRVGFVHDLGRAGEIDQATVEEILSLLAADETQAAADDHGLAAQAPDLLDELAAGGRTATESALLGRRFGSWEVVRLLGQGGMGTVCLVQRERDGIAQSGALKLIRAGWDSPALARRFQAERRILAALDHPGIARLLDAGTEAGQPWLVMEYVQGTSILAHCESVQAALRQRLSWFLQICEALVHAHRNLIVHRDLKPGNVLIDEAGRVKLLDFGIAKLLQDEDAQTGTGEQLYTPEYAAPEQVRGEPVSTSVDVYALGVLLFELISGQRPWVVTGMHPAERALLTLQQEPRRPSEVAAQGNPHRQWANRVGGDLDAIVLKALRKQPTDRYASVSEFAADVQRFLQRQPVLARRGNWRYRARRFLQRHALASALGSLSLAAILVGSAATLWQARQAEAARQLAEREAQAAQAVAEFMTGVFARANPELSGVPDPSAQLVLDLGTQALEADQRLQPAVRAALLAAVARAYVDLGLPALGLALLDEQDAVIRGAGNVEAHNAALLARAISLNDLGDPRAAVQALAPLELQRERLAPKLRTELDYIAGLALNNLRENEQALPRLLRAYDELRTAHGLGAPQLSAVVPVLISVHNGLGRVEQGLQIASDAWNQARLQQLPPALRKNYGNAYGLALLRAGTPEQAEPVLRDVLRLSEAVYGPNDPKLVVDINNVAVALIRQGQFAEAEALYRRCLALRLAEQPPDPIDVAKVEVQLGTVALGMGRLTETLEWTHAALTRWDTSGKPPADRYLIGLLNATEANLRLGEEAAAEDLLSRAEPFLDGELQRIGQLYRSRGLLLRARLSARQDDSVQHCGDTARLLQSPPGDAFITLQAHILHAHCERRLGRPWHAVLEPVSAQDPLLDRLDDDVRSYWLALQEAHSAAE